jgi:hypothetical protein
MVNFNCVTLLADNQHEESFVLSHSFIVCAASRINQAPVAIAKPSMQEVNQPNDLVIDGSGNSFRSNL